jgi:hypothetical protein
MSSDLTLEGATLGSYKSSICGTPATTCPARTSKRHSPQKQIQPAVKDVSKANQTRPAVKDANENKIFRMQIQCEYFKFNVSRVSKDKIINVNMMQSNRENKKAHAHLVLQHSPQLPPSPRGDVNSNSESRNNQN